MPRPKRYQGVIITSFYVPIESKEIIEKAKELAHRDATTLSEIILEALKEYIEKHYPGNPQIPLMVYTGEVEPAKTLEAKITAKQLREDIDLLKRLRKVNTDGYYLYQVETRIIKMMKKLTKLNHLLKNKEYTELIKRAEEVLNL